MNMIPNCQLPVNTFSGFEENIYRNSLDSTPNS
jgi:hypothetical protein